MNGVRVVGIQRHYVNHYRCFCEPQLNIKTLTLRGAAEGKRGALHTHTHKHIHAPSMLVLYLSLHTMTSISVLPHKNVHTYCTQCTALCKQGTHTHTHTHTPTHTPFKAATQFVCCLLSGDEQLSVCICVIVCSLHPLPSTIRRHRVLTPCLWKSHWSELKPGQRTAQSGALGRPLSLPPSRRWPWKPAHCQDTTSGILIGPSQAAGTKTTKQP